MRIMRLLIADPDVNIPIPLTNVLKHGFSSIEHRVQDIFSPVESLLPLILERHSNVSFVWFCLQSKSEGFALERSGGVYGLDGEFVGSLERMRGVVRLDGLTGGQRMIFADLDHIIR